MWVDPVMSNKPVTQAAVTDGLISDHRSGSGPSVTPTTGKRKRKSTKGSMEKKRKISLTPGRARPQTKGTKKKLEAGQTTLQTSSSAAQLSSSVASQCLQTASATPKPAANTHANSPALISNLQVMSPPSTSGAGVEHAANGSLKSSILQENSTASMNSTETAKTVVQNTTPAGLIPNSSLTNQETIPTETCRYFETEIEKLRLSLEESLKSVNNLQLMLNQVKSKSPVNSVISASSQPSTSGSDVSDTDDNVSEVQPHDAEIEKSSFNSEATVSSHTNTSNVEHFQKKLKESISQLSVNLYITKCGISGPPSTGKTHFLELLLGRKRPSKQQSTPLLKSAVEVIRADLVSATKQKNRAFKWTLLEKDPWIRLLANTIYEDIRKKGMLQEICQWKELESTFDSLSDFSKDVLKRLCTSAKKNLGTKKSGRESSDHTLSDGHLIYLVDTGGQSQFHEILPHFMRSSVYFLVHNLSEDLMHCPEFEYIFEDRYTVPETMKMSNKSIIEQAARSACSTYHTDMLSKKTPAIAVIGMFKDKCDDASEVLHKKSDEIKAVLKQFTESKTKCEIIKFSREQCIFPFDASEPNWDQNCKALETLKNEIYMYAYGIESHAKNSIKLSYFIFLQNLKRGGKKNKTYMTIDECEKIAQESYIPLDKQEMVEALRLFHELNLILYFHERKEVDNLVFLDPNFLFQMVTDIIVLSFDKVGEKSQTNNDFQQSGIFTKRILLNNPQIMHYLSEKPDSSDLSLDMFLCILQQLCIISKLPDTSYFMPCVLQLEDPHKLTPECNKELDDIQRRMSENKVGGPLVISFGDRILPRGLFCVMVVILSNKYGWHLKMDRKCIRRRNLMEFSVNITENYSTSCLGSCVIFDKITHIEVLTTCQSDDCFHVSGTLEMALYEACNILKYDTTNFGIEKGFHCELPHSAGTDPHHTVVSRNTNKKLVQKCHKGHGVVLERKYSVWFQSNKEYSKEVKIEKSNTLITEIVHATNHWEFIGVSLELTAVDLDRIQKDCSDEESRFMKVLTTWEKRGNPPFTWNTIVDVLKSPLVNENVLAKKLFSKYCS